MLGVRLRCWVWGFGLGFGVFGVSGVEGLGFRLRSVGDLGPGLWARFGISPGSVCDRDSGFRV